MTEYSMRTVKTPLGVLWLVALDDALWGAEFEPRWEVLAKRLVKKGIEVGPGAVRKKESAILTRCAAAVAGYFRGDWSAISSVPLALEGSTFQLAVWRRVRKIRPGKTLSYGELAEAVGSPRAFRAMGAANAANPCVLFVPDHRVVSSSGDLRGYGAGVDQKAWLLAHEKS
jgi:O-6-methylguanine DNA methyltransferase